MVFRGLAISLLSLGVVAPLWSQASQDSRFKIIGTVLAQQAAARIGLPFGGEGVELSESGQIDRAKLDSQLKKNGQSVAPGAIVKITDISFDDKAIEFELDGGGKDKNGILGRIQIGVGPSQGPAPDSSRKARGSKVTLRFAAKVPKELTPDGVRKLLEPVLDFKGPDVPKTGLDALPQEFREAVMAKQARVGMDRDTVRLALGPPNARHREPVDGVEREDWIYEGKGPLRRTFVTFEGDVVVGVKEF